MTKREKVSSGQAGLVSENHLMSFYRRGYKACTYVLMYV